MTLCFMQSDQARIGCSWHKISPREPVARRFRANRTEPEYRGKLTPVNGDLKGSKRSLAYEVLLERVVREITIRCEV